MLAETVREWTEQWVEQGIEQGFEQGRAQGIEQGRVEERALLCRQAAEGPSLLAQRPPGSPRWA